MQITTLTQSEDGLVYNLPIEDNWILNSELEMHDVLFSLVRYWKPNLVFESGCFYGFSTLALARACAANVHGRVVTCDTDSYYVQQTIRRVTGLPCQVVHADSISLPELRIADFIFSDSSYEAREREYEVAKPGALIVVHDANHEREVGDFVRSKGGFIIPRGRGFGLMVKNG